MSSSVSSTLETRQGRARETLDAWVREVVASGTSIPETGALSGSSAPGRLGFDPREEVRGYDDLDRFGVFQDEWLRGGPVRRWVPKGLRRTGRSPSSRPAARTGVPKSRISIDDFRIDYEPFSATLPDAAFPEGRRLAA